MNRVEQAVSCFNEGFSCAQAILSAYGVSFGLDRETCLRIATGFGAGMGRMARTCGAVTGALMVIGLKHGRTRADDEEAKEKTYALVNAFVKRFKDHHGSSVCRELLGNDISTPEGMKAAEEKGVFTDLCPKLVRSAAEILEEML